MPVAQFRRLILCIAICSLSASAFSQSAGRYIKEADDFFEHGQYREALRYYKEGGNEQTWSKDTKLRAAICMYEINDVNSAINVLNGLEREVNTPAMVFFYLARAYQQNERFSEAIKHYKSFLRESKDSDPRREWVKDEILRCGYATSAKFGEQLAYVENLGTSLNTFYDEFGPVPSPLYTDRLYFTSARSGSKGGLKDPKNEDDQKYGRYSADMYFSEIQNGIWRAAQPMDVLNSTRNDVIYGFSSDGQRLFYFSGEGPSNGQLVIDTFSVPREGAPLASKLGPFDPNAGDKDLFVFSDSIIIFSSNKAGGEGGYDLYYSIERNGQWSNAINLGSVVNSFYDDATPFLTRNGRTLFFASNRLNSFGGLDIFRADFNDSTSTWNEPVNMGLPINSAADDAHFFVSTDGLTAFLSSDRKSGYGSRDIYAAYMKSSVQSHLALGFPVSFIQLLPLRAAQTVATTTSNNQTGNEAIKEYYIGDLGYDANDVVLTPQNLKKLDVLSNLLLIYPTLTADLICHDVVDGPKSFDLYFSIKKSEQVADYLERRGIQRNRLYIKGCGSFYPRAIPPDETTPNPNLDRLNRRIEVNVYGIDGLPISVIYENPNVPTETVNEDARTFRANHKQLTYRVQIASVNQLLQSDIFNDVEDAMIQWDPTTRTYKYYVGMTTDYETARGIRDDIRTKGFGDAFIVAHYMGKAVTPSDISMLAGEYPDLLRMEKGE